MSEGRRMGEGPSRPGSDSTFCLEVSPDPDQVRTARLFAAAVARHFGADENRVEDLKVAISEAATNSIKAHRGAGVSEPIRISADSEADGIRFTVRDAGDGFPIGPGPEFRDSVTPVPGLFEGSLGLTLIRSLFPDVEITANEDRGMNVSFVLEVPRKNGSD
ncbi:MAG: ATP-binding protein [Actinomycetota bacterium]